MAYTSVLIANNVLNRSFAERCLVPPMKLQRIMYFVASEYQKRTGRSLFSERFETWQYGPVLRSVYSEFRPFAGRDITRFSKNAKNKALMIDEGADPALQRALDVVWATSKRLSPVALSRITQMKNSAWDKAFQNDRPFLSSDDIPADDTYIEWIG